MTHRILLLILLFLDFHVANSQENMVYISHPPIDENMTIKPIKSDNGNWGLVNSKTQKIIVKPSYKLLGDFVTDSFYIFVDNNNRFGALNSDGSIKVPFDNYIGSFEINRYDSSQRINNILIAPYKVYGKYPKDDLYLYFIDSNGNCKLANYYTCPSNVKIETKNAPISMIAIQKAESYKSMLMIDSAIHFCKLAIESDSTNPYLYYWGCKLLLVNESSELNAKNNNKYGLYYPWLELCLSKAEELEKNYHYLFRIKKLKYDFYLYNKIDKMKAKNIKNELDVLKKRIKNEKNCEMWLYHY